MIKKNLFEKFKKGFNSVAVLTLLLPNLMGVGVVAAEEVTAEEPETEEVEELDVETDETVEETETPPAPEPEKPAAEEEVIEEVTEEEPAAAEETPQDETPPPAEEPTEAEELTPLQEAAPAQVTGIVQENLVYENGTLTLHNQEPGTNIAAVLPNDSLIFTTVPFHGRWSPRQNLARNRIYAGDEIEFFTYSGTVRGESIFLTVEGEGETRPADQFTPQYGRQNFSFIPTARDSRVLYSTEPFFTVVMTFPDGTEYTQVANPLGTAAFPFPEDFTPVPGQVFSAVIYDREGELLDLNNPDLFRNLTIPHQTEVTVYGEVPPEPAVHTVSIDPNGGTIDDAYASTEVNEGETYTVPYTFQSNLARPGYTLTGYTVEGTLHDADGNPVTELPRFTGVYTPLSDVTLTANWEVTSGGFRLRDRIDNFITDERSFALTDGENTYPLTSNSYTNQFRTWTVDDVPNGVYTLLVNGLAYPNEWNLETTNPNSSATIAEDGTVTVDLTFGDDSTTTFVRFDLTMNEYEVGVEVRDLNNQRTSDVGIRVENEEGTVFEGSYDQYNLWTTAASVLPGQYTITLDTPEGTLAEINDTVSSQAAEATDEENVFTLAVNRESRGNLSRVFGAFRLVEAAEEIETHPLGIEIRDLAGRRTSDVTIYVQNEDGVVFSGSYNQYAQWISDEELPVGEYTITLQTPDNTYAVVQDTTQQHAVPTDRQNVFTIAINEENRGNLSRVFAAFQLVEREYRLGVEIRGLDGRRTSDVGVIVTNEDEEVFAGAYNEYLQWLTTEELPAGEYRITLDTPEGTAAEINDIASNYAVPTEEGNVFTIQLNEANLGYSSTIYGAFRLVEVPAEPVETYEDIETTQPIAYETEYRNNPNLPRGERRVVQSGVEGSRTVTERVYYEDGVEVRRETIDESTTPAVNEIIEIGTKSRLNSIIKKAVNVVTKVVKSIFGWFF